MAGDDGVRRPRWVRTRVAEARVADSDRARRSGRARPVAGPLRRAAAAGDRLPDGVPDPGEPGRGPDRRARPACPPPIFSTTSPPSSAGAAPASGRCRRCSGSGAGDGAIAARRLGRRRAVAGGRRRLRERARARGAVRAADLRRRRRPGLLRVRLGDPARRDRLPLHLPLPAARRPAVPAPSRRRAPVVWLLRWLAMRVMWGAGLIKLRGDPCWRDLTCLDFHFETQPIPNPLSAAFHFLPRVGAQARRAVQPRRRAGGAVLHVRAAAPLRCVAGALMAGLQLVLIASGNLSFLNWLTLVPDPRLLRRRLWRRVLPRAARRARRAARAAGAAPSRAQGATVARCAVAVALLSIASGREHAVGQADDEHVVHARCRWSTPTARSAASAASATSWCSRGRRDDGAHAATTWRAYEWKCQPGDPARRPCWMSPYHYRLDWLLWFAAMGDARATTRGRCTWRGSCSGRSGGAGAARDRSVRRRAAPPHPRRASIAIGSRRAARGAWWTRERVATWLPPRLARQRGAADLLAPPGLAARRTLSASGMYIRVANALSSQLSV